MSGATKQYEVANADPGMLDLIERESEFAELDSLITAAALGDGAAVLIEGPAGIGKTALLRTAETLGEQVGLSVLSARGGELERGLPWAVVRDLLVPALRHADDGDPASLFSGAAGLARPVLAETTESAPSGSDQLAELLHGLYWLTSNLSQRRSLLLAIDDAHWADPASLDFLTYLAQRIGDLSVLLLVAGRPAEPESEMGRLETLSNRMRVIRPSPLSVDGVEELIHRDFEQQPDPEFVAACHRATGGNPFLLSELQIELHREAVGPVSENAARVSEVTPEAISHAVLLRLTRLPEPALRLAQSVAAMGASAGLAEAAELAGLDRDAAAAHAEELADIEVLGRDLPLTFVHPLVRQVVYEQMTASARARLHGKAAELLGERDASAEEIAVHLLEVEPAGAPATVESLREAAREARAHGVPESAATCLRRALAEPPAPEQRPALLIELGEAEALAGLDTATARLDEALSLFDDPNERAATRLGLGYMLHRGGQPEEAAAEFERGLQEVRGDEELEATLRTAHMAIAMLLDVLSPADLESTIEVAESRPDRRLSPTERERLAYQALARVSAGLDHEGAVRLSGWALDEGAWLLDEGVTVDMSFTVGCLFWSDALEEAEEAIRGALEWARREGDFTTQAYAMFGLAAPCYWRGRLAEAAADAQAAIEAWRDSWGMHLAFAGVHAAMALIELDQLDQAEEALEAAKPAPSGAPVYEASYRSGRARVLLARGDSAASLEEFRVVEQLAGGIPYLRNPITNPWRSDAALAALACGEGEEARRFASEELRIAERFGAPRQLGVALRAMGAVQSGQEGLARLRDSVAALERSPARFELCRSLLELGAALRRSGARKEAREHLRGALALAHEFGAIRVERRAREELEASGARPRRIELSGPASLTPSEGRVCELAAGGATNREIAQQLFVSLRTVETHLTHAYRKLDISSRAELAEALGGRA